MKPIDGDGLKRGLESFWREGRLMMSYDGFNAFIEQYQVKSPEELLRELARVERVIKYFDKSFGGYRTHKSIADLIRFLFDEPQDTWKDEDFEEEIKP